jgi:hypothetical protein
MPIKRRLSHHKKGGFAPVRSGRKVRATPSDLPILNVAEIRDMYDFWGRRLARPIPPGLLRSAIQQHLAQTPNLLLESLSRLIDGPVALSELTEIKVTLFQEGDFQHIFRVTVRRRSGGRLRLAMVVAKDAKISKMAQLELSNLHHLYRRDARFVVRPLSGGMLPVDPSGPSIRAMVYVYFTEWLTGLHELGVDRAMNYFINEIPFYTFRPAVSDIIRGQILTIVLGYWDPASRTAMEPPQIASGDFVISRPRPGEPVMLGLIACRKILKSVSLAQCLRLFLGYQGQWAGRVFHLLPKDPQLLFNALYQGLVVKNQKMITWDQVERELKSFTAELSQRPREDIHEWTPLPTLRKLIGSLPLLKNKITVKHRSH